MGIGKKVGSKIRQFRETRGLTQAQLADILGKSVETISNFERGKVVTSLLTLEQLARHLNVRIRDFFDEDAVVMVLEPSSAFAVTVRNAADILPEEDLEVVAGLVAVLEARKRREGRGDAAKLPTP